MLPLPFKDSISMKDLWVLQSDFARFPFILNVNRVVERTILHLICVWNAFCRQPSDVHGRSHMQQICVLSPATPCCSTWSRCHSFHYAQCACDVKDKAMISAVRSSRFLSRCPPPTPHLGNVSKTSESSRELNRRFRRKVFFKSFDCRSLCCLCIHLHVGKFLMG